MIFLVAPDGLFIDAIAVAHDNAAHACKLSALDGGMQLKRKGEGVGFQRLGLGNFLLALVAHVATLECLNEGALLFLKTNNSRLGFYKKRGYASLVASLPAKLRKLVPSTNYITTASETTLLSTPVSVLRIRGAGKKDTLTKGATRSSGLPDSDDSDDDTLI